MLSLYISEIFIYFFSFVAVYLYKRGLVAPTSEYYYYLLFYLISAASTSLFTQKFKVKSFSGFADATKSYFISFFLMLGLLAFLANFFQIGDISRTTLILSLLFALIIELIWLRLRLRKEIKASKSLKIILSTQSFFIEIILFIAALFYLIFNRFHGLDFFLNNAYLIFGFFGTWFAAVSITHHFQPIELSRGFWKSSWGHIKSYVIWLALTGFMIFIVRLDETVRVNFFQSVFLYSGLSFSFLIYFYIKRTPADTDEVNLKFLKATTYQEFDNFTMPEESGKILLENNGFSSPQFDEKLKNVYLKKDIGLYYFIANNIELNSIDIMKSMVIRSSDLYNVEVFPDESLDFFLNLHQMNDMRRLNLYFIEVNKKLVNNGVFIGRFEPIRFRYKRIVESYPFYLGHFFYFFDFIWKRAFPKLPFLKNIYFELTKGKNRAFSLAEGLGRLYYCGFEVTNFAAMNNYLWFIAKKVKEPSKDKNPSYGPLFKMRRLGKNGKMIFVYKMRTMHPYAEYLQKLVFEKFNLQEGGKFSNDFRITSWGRFLRKLWLDEFPMFINFFRGELKLVGVRPLSQHYLSLYSAELREKRLRHKPGLIPPFYKDMPKTLEEIMASEMRYLIAYEKNPFLTDINYLFSALFNIFIKRARSA